MEKFEDNLTFEDIINQTLKKVKVGSTITGTIVEINGKGEIFVDIGYKADGIIPRNEYFSEKGLEPADEYKVGDKIKADVLKLNDGQGNVLMSCKHAKIKEIRKEFKEKVDNKEVFEEEIKSLSRDADGDYCAQKYGKHECRNTNKPRSFGIRIRSFYKMEKRFSNFFSHSRFPPYYRCNYRRFPLRRASLS